MFASFLKKPCQKSHRESKETDAVREIFYDHWNTMKTEMLKTIDRIEQWRDASIKYIRTYANEQISVLHHDYNLQRGNFDKLREEKISEVKNLDSKSSQIQQLYQRCQSLQFEVAKLETIKYEMDHLVVKTINPPLQKGQARQSNWNESAAANTTTTRSPLVNGEGSEGSTADSLDSSPSSIRVTSGKVRSPLPPINGRTRAGKEIEEAAISGTDQEIPCPICFMIFPPSLSRDERQRHVNQHCVDYPEQYSSNF